MERPAGTIPLIATPDMREFADRIFQRLNDPRFSRQDVDMVQFANKEYKPRIPETVRREDVYLLHSLYYPDPNTSYIQLLLTTDALSRAAVDSIGLVLPFMPYLRQDRKDEPRVPISARLFADLIETIPRVDRIITVDMHSEAEQGFYGMSVDNLPGWIVYERHFRERFGDTMGDVVVVAPDAGGVKRATKFAKRLGDTIPAYSMDKRRAGPNEVDTMHFVGDVENIKGKRVILYDDMIDTGTSIARAAQAVLALGAREVYICASHGIFSASKKGIPEEILRATGLEVIVTESIPRPPEYRAANSDWLTILPLDDLIAETIKETSTVGGSVSRLFERR